MQQSQSEGEGSALPLPHQHFNLAWLRVNLFGLMSLNRHQWSSSFLMIGSHQFKGGGSAPLTDRDTISPYLEKGSQFHLRNRLGRNIAAVGNRLHRNIGSDGFQLVLFDQPLIDTVKVIHVPGDNLDHIIVISGNAEEVDDVVYGKH